MTVRPTAPPRPSAAIFPAWKFSPATATCGGPAASNGACARPWRRGWSSSSGSTTIAAPRWVRSKELVAVSRERGGIAVAQARTPSGYVYGGARLGRWTIERIPCGPDEILPCDTLTGNCVVLPRAAVEQTGYPDARRLPHVLADADYGLRAHRLGIPIWVVGAHVCQNEDNLKNHMLSWLLSGVPLPRLWRDVLSKRSALHPGTAWTFYTRHFGLLRGGAIIVWGYGRLGLISLARLLLPRRFIEWLYARRSAAWQTQRFYEGCESAHLRSANPLPPPP